MFAEGASVSEAEKRPQTAMKRTSVENRQDRSSYNTRSDVENNIVEGVKDNENVEPGDIEKGNKLLENQSQTD